MACLEHTCVRCSWFCCDNDPAGPMGPCPECGGTDFRTSFDEEPERDDDEGFDYDRHNEEKGG